MKCFANILCCFLLFLPIVISGRIKREAEEERPAVEEQRRVEEVNRPEQERITEEQRLAEEKQRILSSQRAEEERRAEEARALEAARVADEERLAAKSHPAEEAAHSEATVSAARAEEEARRAEEEAHRAEEKARRTDEEARRAEEGARRSEEEARRVEEKARRTDEEVRRLEEEARRVEEKARRTDELARRAEEEARRSEEEARRAEEGARRLEEEARRVEEEARRTDEIARRAEEEARRSEEEGRRAEEENRRAEEEARRTEESSHIDEQHVVVKEEYTKQPPYQTHESVQEREEEREENGEEEEEGVEDYRQENVNSGRVEEEEEDAERISQVDENRTHLEVTSIASGLSCGQNRGGCDHECRMEQPGNEFEPRVQCSCYSGFTLDPNDGKTCHDPILPTEHEDECNTPDGGNGSCKSREECPELDKYREKYPQNEQYYMYFNLSNQICDGKPEVYCCPNPDKKTVDKPIFIRSLPRIIEPVQTVEARLLSASEGCGMSNVVHRKVVGGVPAKPGAWPWLALLGYQETNEINFRCGGSLVTKRHVVTAGHCTKPAVILVRLGEHNVNSMTEAQHIDVQVLRTITHPSYHPSKSKDNDIGMVVLAEDVQFRDNIRPICVPDKSYSVASLVGLNPFAAGWGFTKEGGNPSEVLQEVQLPILANSECKERYREQNGLSEFDDAIVCAGELAGGKDVCQGDSGGPLMLPARTNDNVFYYNLIGVVAHGIGCARKGFPTIYSSVPYFSDWIKQTIAESI